MGHSNNFFAERAGVPLPETYFHLGGGAFGGPIVRNRTFFWFSTEGYGSNTTRNGSLRAPDLARAQRRLLADVRQRRNARRHLRPADRNADGNGRQPFPGNVIPPNRMNPVARAMASFLPQPMRDVSDGNANFDSTAEIDDRAIMYTGKVDHRFSDRCR